MDTAFKENQWPNTNGTADSKGVTQKLNERELRNDVKQSQVEVSSEDLIKAKSRQHKVQDTDIAKGTASLGRAAEPPPSEKSSTLDAKDSKRPLLDEATWGSDIPESAAPSSALLITGALPSRRRPPRFAVVSIPPTNQFDSTATSGLNNPSPPSYQQLPPVPPCPQANMSLTANHNVHLSPPAPEPAPPPVPPKTYLQTTPQAATTSDHEAPPLPQRLYLPDNEDQGLQMSIEELGSAGVLHKPAEVLGPLEEEGEIDGDTVRSAKPLTTVLLPKELKHSNTDPRNLHITYVEKCSKCPKMKKMIAKIWCERNFLCDCCKKKTKVSRRSST